MSDRNTPTGHTNVMEAQAAAKLAAETSDTVAGPFSLAEAPESGEGVIITGEQDKLMEMIEALTIQVAELQIAQTRTENREVEITHDLTEDMLYIVRRNDRKWEERRIVNGKGVMIEFQASNFFGPFKDKEHVAAYIAAKSIKRPEYAGIWANNDVLTGREARRLDVEETHSRDMAFGTHAAMGVLDQRIFAEAQGGHTPGQGTLIGRN